MAAELGDEAAARSHWHEGASARPWPTQGPASPREGYQPEARYYKSLCLQKLGRSIEAAELL